MSFGLSSLTNVITKENLYRFFDKGPKEYQNRAVLLCTVAFVTARLFSQGLANFFALETLRHGTNPFFWLGIHAFGALPLAGGNKFGGDYGCGFDAQNRNHFYCAYDVDLFNERDPRETHLHSNLFIILPYKYLKKNDSNNFFNRIGRAILNSFATTLLPKTYTCSSTENLCNDGHFIMASSMLVPNVKFHISQERLHKDFCRDSSYPEEWSYSTTKWVAPINSGLIGVLWNSLTYKTPLRMIEQPKKVFLGSVQVGVALGIAALIHRTALPLLQYHSKAVLIGAITAAI